MIEVTGTKFCGECGNVMIAGAVPMFFSGDTGNPVHRAICSQKKCEHSGHWWVPDGDREKLTLWEALVGWRVTCADCGATSRDHASAG